MNKKSGRPKTGKYLNCTHCEKSFYAKLADIKRRNTKYCSTICAGQDRRMEKCPNWKKGFYVNENGYKRIYVNGKYVYEHRYIMEQFLERKLNRDEQIHHIDRDKLNNNIENLQILSPSEHTTLHDHSGENNNLAKLKEQDVLQIRKMYSEKHTTTQLSDLFNTEISNIRLIVRRKTWKHI